MSPLIREKSLLSLILKEYSAIEDEVMISPNIKLPQRESRQQQESTKHTN